MIKFEIKDNKTGKTSTYTKDAITMGEAERFYETMDKMNKEAEKENAKASNVRKIEREFFVSLFADQGLTEEDVLENMSTRAYKKRLMKYFAKSMQKMTKIQKMQQKKWERQKNNNNKDVLLNLKQIQRFCMEKYGWTLTEVKQQPYIELLDLLNSEDEVEENKRKRTKSLYRFRLEILIW